MSFSVTPQISGDSVLTLEPDAPSCGRPAVVESDMLRAWPTARRWWCPVPANREIKEKKAVGISGGCSAAAPW